MGQPQERRRGQERLHHRAIEQDPYLVGRCREQRRRIPRDHDGLVAGLGGHVVPRRQPAVVFNRRFNLPRESCKQVTTIVLPWSIDSCTTRNLDSRLFRTQKNRAVQSQLQLYKANKPVPLVVLVVVRDMNTDRLALLDVWRQQRHGELNHPQVLRHQRRHARHEAAYLEERGRERERVSVGGRGRSEPRTVKATWTMGDALVGEEAIFGKWRPQVLGLVRTSQPAQPALSDVGCGQVKLEFIV